MRFASIEITNYRQYKNLCLEFKRGDNDLQIIVGDNGTGKTNLLNAFTWCLYGTEPHLGNESKDKGEPKLNKAVLFDMVNQGIQIEDVKVQIEIETDEGFIRVLRSVPFRVTGIKSWTEKTHEMSLIVTFIQNSGKSNTMNGDFAQEFINRHLPESIREYFFFDGEQLDNYFAETRTEVLRSAVHSISNIDSITKMKERTRASAKSLSSKATPKATGELDAVIKKIQELQTNLENYEKKIAADEEKLGKVQDKISNFDEQLRGLPKVEELEKKISDLKAQLRIDKAAYKAASEQYYVFARTAYVDFAFYEAAQAADAVISAMEKDNQLPPAIDPGLLRSMLSAHMCEVCKRPLSEDEETHIQELLELYRVGTETSALLTALRGELRNLMLRVQKYPQEKKRIFDQIEYAENKLDHTTNALDAAEKDYQGCPNPEKVKQLRLERKAFEAERSMLEQNIGKQKGYRDATATTLRKKRDEYTKLVQAKGLGDEFQVAADFGMRAAAILEQVEKEVIEETRMGIEREAEQLFKGLVWKDSKCSSIGLTENYQLSLYDKYGFSCAGTCSAAERNLLALSFTLAMHKVSGFESPMFIDTPIARASGDNRSNFAATLAEVSKGKQLILTFTPDEYSESIASVFDPIAAANMRLSMDGSEMVVSLKGGE